MDDPGQPDPPPDQVVEHPARGARSSSASVEPAHLSPLRDRIRRAAAATGVQTTIVEKDYALSYVLAGLAEQPALARTLVFKGGTALKKIYFSEYRFSEDLDFSAREAPRGAEMEEAFRGALALAQRYLQRQGLFELQAERLVLREPHPAGQDAFYIWVRFPWHRPADLQNARPPCRVKVEITHDEPVLLEPEARALFHGYEEELPVQILAYRLEEVVAEKMRALRQTHEKLLVRGWTRPRARDYYDLWRVLTTFGDTLDRTCLPALLAQKCAHRGVSYQSLEDFFTEPLVAEAMKQWKTNIQTFAAGAPPGERVLEELRALLPGFFPGLL